MTHTLIIIYKYIKFHRFLSSEADMILGRTDSLTDGHTGKPIPLPTLTGDTLLHWTHLLILVKP